MQVDIVYMLAFSLRLISSLLSVSIKGITGTFLVLTRVAIIGHYAFDAVEGSQQTFFEIPITSVRSHVMVLELL